MNKDQRTGPDHIYLPELIFRGIAEGEQQFTSLLAAHAEIKVLDQFQLQKKELFKTRSPGKRLAQEDLDKLYTEWIAGRKQEQEGIWIYYSWLNTIIHTLSKDEFIELRTNRNHYKISPDEQNVLAKKKIGIIGLSVGHAVAICMATERICGKLKLADFDQIELSNLNRIKTGILNIGINKCVATAREIAEIDPFLEIECYPEGITEDNLEAFLLESGKLDILVDECDGLDVKILCRQAAKMHRIPVVMETSDKGLLDVERYDLEEDRPILHGLLNGIPLDNLKNASNEQKIPIILKIADIRRGSLRGKVSMLEVGQSISTWPQLASAVTLGGGVVTDVCRRILLDQYNESGRYYIDLETIAGNTKHAPDTIEINPYQPFKITKIDTISVKLPDSQHLKEPAASELEALVEAACMAPSTANDQPWKWVYKSGQLCLFHDKFRSHSFGDFKHMASYISFGAACENLLLKSIELGLKIKINYFPLADNNDLVAAISFLSDASPEIPDKPYDSSLAGAITTRLTNRNPSIPVAIPDAEIQQLKDVVESIDGAVLHCVTDKNDMLALGRVIGECDRIKLLNKNGHKDFVERELRWTPEEADNSKDGVDIRTLGLSGPLMAVLALIKDAEVADSLKKINGGKTLVDAAMMTASTASFIGIITLPKYSAASFLAGGIAMQRLWLKASQLDYAIHPMISPFHLFPRLLKGNGEGLDQQEIEKLKVIRQQFMDIVPVDNDAAEVFMFKIGRAQAPGIKTLRLPLSETLFVLSNN